MNLNQITILSQDLNKSAAFYQLLGFQLIVDSIPRYARFLLPNGNTTFSLHYSADFVVGNGVSIYFECADLDQKVETLKSKGIVFDQDPVDQVWEWREARLTDPDGYTLILYKAGEFRVNPPWRI